MSQSTQRIQYLYYQLITRTTTLKTILNYLLFFSFLLPFTSCDTDEIFRLRELDRNEDYLVFGTVAGVCSEGYKTFFLLTENDLRISSEETKTEASCDKTLFVEQPLSQEDFEVAFALFDIPDVMINEGLVATDLDFSVADGAYYWAGRIDGKCFEIEIPFPSDTAPEEFLSFFKRFIDVKAFLSQ